VVEEQEEEPIGYSKCHGRGAKNSKNSSPDRLASVKNHNDSRMGKKSVVG